MAFSIEHQEGQAAFLAGKDWTANPYNAHREFSKYSSWNRGWSYLAHQSESYKD